MKTQIASMIASHACFTARRPDKAKHQPKVLNITNVESKDGPRVSIKRVKQPHIVWRGGVQYEVTKAGLVAI